MNVLLLNLLVLVISHIRANAQAGETYAELGFPKGKKVIILHVDDAGMSYESNVGTMHALDKALKAYIDKEGIIITTWRELMERRKKS